MLGSIGGALLGLANVGPPTVGVARVRHVSETGEVGAPGSSPNARTPAPPRAPLQAPAPARRQG